MLLEACRKTSQHIQRRAKSRRGQGAPTPPCMTHKEIYVRTLPPILLNPTVQDPSPNGAEAPQPLLAAPSWLASPASGQGEEMNPQALQPQRL